MASRFGGPSTTLSRFPRGGGAAVGGRIHRRKTHVIPFSDHAGRSALMVFDSWVTSPLPPLFAFAVYFTHPQVTPETVKPVEVLEAVKRRTPIESCCAIRLDIYFLPGSDGDGGGDEECIAHYRKEKAARGDYTRQIQDLKNSAADDVDGEQQQQGGASDRGNDCVGQLPGVVPSYIDTPNSDYWHKMLFRYPGADWSTDDERLARYVKFDRISEEEYAHATDGNDEFYRLPPVYVWSMPFQESDTTRPGETFVGMAMFDAAHAMMENEANSSWYEARERGWKSW
ncbi:hypothetical protein E8E13_011385 [Curvularia kusanoi]|uniref:Uncharacterized protein n=1 Tax=Curvularia kusanoi TaxID=90978 RepID=A0A9P4TMN5_CURKU|nr:hypothetical protein E8E13_011385 [Curvularia kusanoi]